MRAWLFGLTLLALNAAEAKQPARREAAAPSVSAPMQSPYEQALQALREGRVSEAVASLQRQLQLTSDHPVARKLLAQLLIDAGRRDEAEAVLKPASDLASLQVLARLQAERGKPDLALSTLQRGADEAGERGDYLAYAGVLAQQARQHAEALKYFARALQTPDAKPAWLLAQAVSQQALEDWAGARSSVQTAMQSGQLSASARKEADAMLRELAVRQEIRDRQSP